MAYNVFGGTLKVAQSISLIHLLNVVQKLMMIKFDSAVGDLASSVSVSVQHTWNEVCRERLGILVFARFLSQYSLLLKYKIGS